MKCHKNNNAYLVKPPPEFKILSGRQLPWKDGVLKWHLANFSEDLPIHQQVSIFKDVFSHYNHELWPLRYVSTDNIEEANHKIYFVRPDDWVYIKGVKTFQSPFLFNESPSTIAVQYTYAPGFQYSMTMFVADKHFYSIKHKSGSFELSKVILHEGLHGLGLDHTDFPGDIMQPLYDPNNVFTEDSRSGLMKLHGRARRDQVKADPSALFFLQSISKLKYRTMNEPKWYGVVRHILTLVGGVLVAFGWFEADDIDKGVGAVMAVIGAVITLVAFWKSITAREKQISAEQYSALKR